MSKEKECKCCKRIWYEDMLDKKLELCPTCYEYCKPLIDGLKIKYKNIADLEAKLAESEKSKESYRLQNEHHHLQLLQFYSRLGVEAFGADIHEKALETLMITKENLAEKDKELAYMTEQAKKFNNEAQKYFEDAYCNDFHKQDKISFCIEQLEKVKEFIGRQLYITTKDCNDLDEAEAKGCNELR